MTDPSALLPEEVAALLGGAATSVSAVVGGTAVAAPIGATPTRHRGAHKAARGIAEALSALCYAPVAARVAYVESAPPPEILGALSDPGCCWLLAPEGAPEPARVVLEISPPLAHALAQRLLGGDAGTEPADRPLSPTQWDVLAMVVARLAPACADLAGGPPVVRDREPSPRLLSDLPGPFVVAAIEIEGPGLSGLMHLLVPAR